MMEDFQDLQEVRLPTEIDLLVPGRRTSIAVYLDEWEALVNRIESCKVSLRPWSIAYSVAFAVGVTAGLSIAPLAFAQLPSWVLTTYIVICALGLGSGFICVIAERVVAGIQHAQIDDLIADMDRMKEPFAAPAN